MTFLRSYLASFWDPVSILLEARGGFSVLLWATNATGRELKLWPVSTTHFTDCFYHFFYISILKFSIIIKVSIDGMHGMCSKIRKEKKKGDKKISFTLLVWLNLCIFLYYINDYLVFLYIKIFYMYNILYILQYYIFYMT